jgi:hypothetical protein
VISPVAEADGGERVPPRAGLGDLRDPNAQSHGEHGEQGADDAEERHGEEHARGGGGAQVLRPAVVAVHLERHVFVTRR